MEPSKVEIATGSSKIDVDQLREEGKPRKERIHLKKQSQKRKLEVLTITADKCRTRSHSRVAAKMAAEAVKRTACARLYQRKQEKDKISGRRKKRIGRKAESTGFQRSHKLKHLSTPENRDKVISEATGEAATKTECFPTETAGENILETVEKGVKISKEKHCDQGIHKETVKNRSKIFDNMQNRLYQEENTSNGDDYNICASTSGSCTDNKVAEVSSTEKRKLTADLADDLLNVHQPRQLRKRRKLLNYNENAAFDLSFKKARVIDKLKTTNGTSVVTEEVDSINSMRQIASVNNTSASAVDIVTNLEGGSCVASMTNLPQSLGSKTNFVSVNSDLKSKQPNYRYVRTIACQTEHTHLPKDSSFCEFCQKSKVVVISTSTIRQTPNDMLSSDLKASTSNAPSVPVVTFGSAPEKKADRAVQPVRKLVPLLPAPPRQPVHGTVLNLGNSGSSGLMQVFVSPNILPPGRTATIRFQQPLTMQCVFPSRPSSNAIRLVTTSSASASGVLPSIQQASVIRAPNTTLPIPFPQSQMRFLLSKPQGSTETPQQRIDPSATNSLGCTTTTCLPTPVTTGSAVTHSLESPIKGQHKTLQPNLSVTLPQRSQMGNASSKVSSPHLRSLLVNESYSVTDISTPSDSNLIVLEEGRWSISELLEQIVNCEDSSGLLSAISEQDKLESKEKSKLDASECCHCHRIFPDARSLTNHSILHLMDGLHECPLCGGFFASINLLESHVRLHKFKGINSKEGQVLFPGNTQPFSCVVCQMKFVYLGDLARHTFNHKQLQPGGLPNHHCVHCDKQFLRQGQLIVHRILSHEDGVMKKCFLCGLELCDSDELVKHIQGVHLGTKSDIPRLQPLQECNLLKNSTKSQVAEDPPKSQDIAMAVSSCTVTTFSSCTAPSTVTITHSASTTATEIRSCNKSVVASTCFETQDHHKVQSVVSNTQLAPGSPAVSTVLGNDASLLALTESRTTSGVSSSPVCITAKDHATSLVSDTDLVNSRSLAQNTDTPTMLPTNQTCSSSPRPLTSTVDAGFSAVTTTSESNNKSTNNHAVMTSRSGCGFPLSLDMPTRTQASDHEAATYDGTQSKVFTDQNSAPQLMTNFMSCSNQLTGKVHGPEKILYRCSACTVKFETANEFAQHCSNCQGPSTVTCNTSKLQDRLSCKDCGKPFLQKHHDSLDVCSENEIVKCSKCQQSFSGNSSENPHLTKLRGQQNKSFECTKCKLEFEVATDLVLHSRMCQQKKMEAVEPVHCESSTCPNCNLSFTDRSNELANHIINCHGNPFININASQNTTSKCQGNKSTNMNAAQNATGKCPDNQPTTKNATQSASRKGYKCHSCKVAFKTALELATHVSQLQEWKNDVCFLNNRRFECSSCQLTFGTAAELASHIRGYQAAVRKTTAKNLTLLNLNSTSKVANLQDSLNRDATESYNVVTNVSSRNESRMSESASNNAISTFGRKAKKVKVIKHFKRSKASTKRSFKNTALTTVSFECIGCHLNFQSLAALTRHRKLKHECRVCSMQFTLTSELLAHFDAIHSGVNYSDSNNVGKLICKVCEKRFHTAQGLLDHFKQHQRFRCPGCKNGFTQKPDFNTHMKKCNKALGRKVYPETQTLSA